MEKAKIKPAKPSKITTIHDALETLNDVADGSSKEIRKMVNRDYRKLRAVFNDEKPELREAIHDFGEASQRSFSQAREQLSKGTKETLENLDEVAHKHPWALVGGTTAIAGILGYLIGRKR